MKKHLNDFDSFLNEQSSMAMRGSLLMQIPLTLDLENDGMVLLQELIEQFNLQIINLWPLGPGGGNAEVIFRGKAEDILGMLNWYAELTGEDAKSYFDTYSTPDAPLPFEVQSDSRMNTAKMRKYVSKDGRSMM
jgi:hypothetical protein